MTKAPKPYDFTNAREAIKEMGLMVEETHLATAEATFRDHKLSNNTANALVLLHAGLVKNLFKPTRYCWKVRVMIALYFLGLVRR